MTYNHKTRTINLDSDNPSAYLIDTGLWAVQTYRTLALNTNSTQSTKINADWALIEGWLGCANRELNPDDINLLKCAWKGYYANGRAPSSEVQPAFDLFAQSNDVAAWKMHKPPAHIVDVFDRMMSSKKHEGFSEDSKIIAVRTEQKSNAYSLMLTKLDSLSKERRLLFTSILAWVVFVIYRSAGYHELLGVELSQWSDESFLQNLLIPPIFVIAVYKLGRWVQAGTKL